MRFLVFKASLSITFLDIPLLVILATESYRLWIDQLHLNILSFCIKLVDTLLSSYDFWSIKNNLFHFVNNIFQINSNTFDPIFVIIDRFRSLHYPFLIKPIYSSLLLIWKNILQGIRHGWIRITIVRHLCVLNCNKPLLAHVTALDVNFIFRRWNYRFTPRHLANMLCM